MVSEASIFKRLWSNLYGLCEC